MAKHYKKKNRKKFKKKKEVYLSQTEEQFDKASNFLDESLSNELFDDFFVEEDDFYSQWKNSCSKIKKLKSEIKKNKKRKEKDKLNSYQSFSNNYSINEFLSDNFKEESQLECLTTNYKPRKYTLEEGIIEVEKDNKLWEKLLREQKEVVSSNKKNNYQGTWNTYDLFGDCDQSLFITQLKNENKEIIENPIEKESDCITISTKKEQGLKPNLPLQSVSIINKPQDIMKDHVDLEDTSLTRDKEPKIPVFDAKKIKKSQRNQSTYEKTDFFELANENPENNDSKNSVIDENVEIIHADDVYIDANLHTELDLNNDANENIVQSSNVPIESKDIQMKILPKNSIEGEEKERDEFKQADLTENGPNLLSNKSKKHDYEAETFDMFSSVIIDSEENMIFETQHSNKETKIEIHESLTPSKRFLKDNNDVFDDFTLNTAEFMNSIDGIDTFGDKQNNLGFVAQSKDKQNQFSSANEMKKDNVIKDEPIKADINLQEKDNRPTESTIKNNKIIINNQNELVMKISKKGTKTQISSQDKFQNSNIISDKEISNEFIDQKKDTVNFTRTRNEIQNNDILNNKQIDNEVNSEENNVQSVSLSGILIKNGSLFNKETGIKTDDQENNSGKNENCENHTEKDDVFGNKEIKAESMSKDTGNMHIFSSEKQQPLNCNRQEIKDVVAMDRDLYFSILNLREKVISKNYMENGIGKVNQGKVSINLKQNLTTAGNKSEITSEYQLHSEQKSKFGISLEDNFSELKNIENRLNGNLEKKGITSELQLEGKNSSNLQENRKSDLINSINGKENSNINILESKELLLKIKSDNNTVHDYQKEMDISRMGFKTTGQMFSGFVTGNKKKISINTSDLSVFEDLLKDNAQPPSKKPKIFKDLHLEVFQEKDKEKNINGIEKDNEHEHFNGGGVCKRKIENEKEFANNNNFRSSNIQKYEKLPEKGTFDSFGSDSNTIKQGIFENKQGASNCEVDMDNVSKQKGIKDFLGFKNGDNDIKSKQINDISKTVDHCSSHSKDINKEHTLLTNNVSFQVDQSDMDMEKHYKQTNIKEEKGCKNISNQNIQTDFLEEKSINTVNQQEKLTSPTSVLKPNSETNDYRESNVSQKTTTKYENSDFNNSIKNYIQTKANTFKNTTDFNNENIQRKTKKTNENVDSNSGEYANILLDTKFSKAQKSKNLIANIFKKINFNDLIENKVNEYFETDCFKTEDSNLKSKNENNYSININLNVYINNVYDSNFKIDDNGIKSGKETSRLNGESIMNAENSFERTTNQTENRNLIETAEKMDTITKSKIGDGLKKSTIHENLSKITNEVSDVSKQIYIEKHGEVEEQQAIPKNKNFEKQNHKNVDLAFEEVLAKIEKENSIMSTCSTDVKETLNHMDVFDTQKPMKVYNNINVNRPMRMYNKPEVGHITTEVNYIKDLITLRRKIKNIFFVNENDVWFNIQFKWAWMSMITAKEYNTDNKNVETYIVNELRKRKELEYSILKRIIEGDDVEYKYMKLMIISIQNNILELFDGFYSSFFEVDNELKKKIPIQTLRIGTVLKIFGATKITKNNNILHQDPISFKINDNCVRISRRKCKLGYQKKYFHLIDLNKISINGGIICGIELKIKKIIECSVVIKVNNFNVTVLENNLEKEIEKIKKLIEESGSTDEKQWVINKFTKFIMISEDGTECLFTWWSPCETKISEIYRFLFVYQSNKSMGMHLITTKKTYHEKIKNFRCKHTNIGRIE